MSHARATVLICACALVANVAVKAAPAPPRRSENKESKMVQEKTIVVRRLPNAYFYPFSLWPLPKYPVRRDEDESYETFQFKRSLKRQQLRRNER